MNPARTIFAILLGYLVFLVLGFFGGILLAVTLHSSGGSSLLIGSETVALISAVLAGAVTARVARARPLAHAIALGLSIFSVTALATAIAPARPHAAYPGWYPYAAAVLGGLGAFVGGVVSNPRDSA